MQNVSDQTPLLMPIVHRTLYYLHSPTDSNKKQSLVLLELSLYTQNDRYNTAVRCTVPCTHARTHYLWDRAGCTRPCTSAVAHSKETYTCLASSLAAQVHISFKHNTATLHQHCTSLQHPYHDSNIHMHWLLSPWLHFSPFHFSTLITLWQDQIHTNL